MCFAPPRRALFPHRNCKNVLRAATACASSTSQLPMGGRAWCGLPRFTSTRASHHNGTTMACTFSNISTSKSRPRMTCFDTSYFEMCFALARLLFDLPEPQHIEENIVFRDFHTFSRACIFSLLTFCISHLLPSNFLHVRVSSWLCFFLAVLLICPYCRRFHFKISFE